MARKKYVWLAYSKTNTAATPFTVFGSKKRATQTLSTPEFKENYGIVKLEVVYGEGRKPKPALAAPPAPTGGATP